MTDHSTNMANANPNPTTADEAAALKQLIETDPNAALAQIQAGESKAALHHLLDTDSQFRLQTSTYSTLLGWTDGTGVWVLEGSEQVYRDLKRLGDDDPSLSYNDCLEKLGRRITSIVSIN